MADPVQKLVLLSSAAGVQIAAAKLHVLHLAPIKEKLGDKWPKLSELVHKLFEKAIRDAQGPRDHFIQVDELSYVVTFNGLAFEEAALACAAIARQVCERLFGGTKADIAVRALVAHLSDGILAGEFNDGSQISALLELIGQEIVVKSRPGKPPSTTYVTAGANERAWEPVPAINTARSSLLAFGLESGLFPVWELAKNKSACLYASAYSRHGRPKIGCVRQLMPGLSDKVPDAEIALLYAATAYAHRVHNAHKVCALGAAVSYETLTNFNLRIRYITALRSLTLLAECPILLKLEDIPLGTPLGKLAELISMLSVPNLRVTLQFKSHTAVPDRIDIRLGAVGIGCALPPHCDMPQGAAAMKRLTHAFAEQKGFIFVEGLDTPALTSLALSWGIRFGTGQALSDTWFSGPDELPGALPLTLPV
jgi:hypothetical protein